MSSSLRLRASLAANSAEGAPAPADEAALQSLVSVFDGAPPKTLILKL